MSEPQRFEGTLHRDGDRTPAVIVGTIHQNGDRWTGEVDLKGLYPQRARETPDGWKLAPADFVLSVRLTPKAGSIFTFEGILNMEQTTMLFAKRKDDTYDFIAGGTMAFAMPEDGIYLTASGNTKISPPAAKMTSNQMADWLRSLKASGVTLSARDGLGHPRSIDV